MKKFAALTTATAVALSLGLLPANASEYEGVLTGHAVAELQPFAQTIAVPSATPSDQGTILVTWYGDLGEQCAYKDGSATPPFCIPLGRVMDAAGNPVSSVFPLASLENGAPYYYGAPYSTYNPDRGEWVAHWSSYALGERTPDQSGIFLRRVSASGQTLGSVFATPTLVRDDQGATYTTEAYDPSNQALVWLADKQEYLLVAHLNDAISSRFIAYMRLSADLIPVQNWWTLIDLAQGNPQGVSAVASTGGAVGISYRATNGDLVFRRIVVGATVSVSGAHTLVASGNIAGTGAALTYDSTSDRFFATYNRGSELRGVRVTNSNSPSSSDSLLVDYSTFGSQNDLNVTGQQRSWVAYESGSGAFHIVQHVFRSTAPTAAGVYLKLSASSLEVQSYSLVADPAMQTADSSAPRTSGRPVISQTGDNIAFAFYSFDSSWQDHSGKQTVFAGFIVNNGQREVQPVPYLGPVVTNHPEVASSGGTVTYRGRDLDAVTSATIAGQPAAIVSKSATALTLRVPVGLAQVRHDVVLFFGTSSIVLANGIIIQDDIRGWTKGMTDGTVKMYAKNLVGAGKVQFFQNGREIAWVRAVDATDPKLTRALGATYLVRTVTLTPGKNALEIYVDGVRIWRAAYTGR